MFDFALRSEPCPGCHCIIGQKLHLFATDLPAHLRWDFIAKAIDPNETWKDAAEYARRIGSFLVTWYHEDADPCVFRYLEGTLNAIVIVALSHRLIRTQDELVALVRHLKHRILEAQSTATDDVAAYFEYRHDLTIQFALHYWVQAAMAFDKAATGEPEGWPRFIVEPTYQSASNLCAGSLTQCLFYLGMADAPKLAKEMNAAAAQKRTAYLKDLAEELRRLLEQLALRLQGQKLATIDKVIDQVRDDLTAYHSRQIAELRHQRTDVKEISDMHDYVVKVCKPSHPLYPIIAEALRVVYQPHRGRPSRAGLP